MPIRAVIFDLMDVLILTGESDERRALETRLGLGEGSLRRILLTSPLFREAIAGRVSAEALWREIAWRLGVPLDDWRMLARTFSSAHHLNDELMRFIRTLRSRYKTAVLTNTDSAVREWGIERFHVEQEVDLVIISAEEGMHKPQPEFFLLAAERLGIQPEEALFVDDEPRYCAAAEAVGMRAIQFRDTDQAIAEIQARLAEDVG
jgi:epoxide hydrolase-like predicted phosphatase